MEEAERLAAAAVDDDDEPGEVGGDNSKDAKDVLLAVMAQADCLARYICEDILRF